MANPFGEIKDSATISNTEYSILDKTTTSVPIAHTGKVKRRVRLDIISMAAGDEYRFRIYEKTNGGTIKPLFEAYINGVQSQAYQSPEFALSEGYDVTMLKTAGTDRVVDWNIEDDIGDRNAISVTAGAINAAAFNADTDTYQAKVTLQDDNSGTTDRYEVVWFKNGQPIFAGITSPTIQVIKASDGSDLIASSSMTQIASTGLYKYDATGGARVVSGAAYTAKVTASIASATRTWAQPVGRDS